jgi:hypothetical protein
MRAKQVATSTATRRGRRLPVILAAVAVAAILLVLVLAVAAPAAGSFPDVPASHPYYAAITDLANRGIIGGYQNGNFGPSDAVQRQQFAKMIVLTGGYPVSESDVCPFTDVPVSGPSGLYPDNYVAVCAANGITMGKTATSFAPYEQITRLQVISMVVRLADKLQPGLLVNAPIGMLFVGTWPNDATHGANARRAIFNGLLGGIDLTLPGTGAMPRGEVAQVLHNLLGKLETITASFTMAGFEKVGGAFTGSPAVCSWGAGRLDVFVRGTNSHLMHRSYSDGAWSNWENLGGELAADSSPAATCWAPGHIDVFVRGMDDALWRITYSGGSWGSFGKFSGDTFTGSPTVCSGREADLDIFVANSAGALMYKYISGIDNMKWRDLGGALASGSSPAAESWVVGRLDVFGRGQDNELWTNTSTSSGGTWTGWTKLGGVFTGSPAVCSWAAGRLDVFVRGTNNHVMHRWYTGSWSGWQDVGGDLASGSSPGCVSWGANRIDILIRGTDGELWHKYWDGSSWKP